MPGEQDFIARRFKKIERDQRDYIQVYSEYLQSPPQLVNDPVEGPVILEVHVYKSPVGEGYICIAYRDNAGNLEALHLHKGPEKRTLQTGWISSVNKAAGKLLGIEVTS